MRRFSCMKRTAGHLHHFRPTGKNVNIGEWRDESSIVHHCLVLSFMPRFEYLVTGRVFAGIKYRYILHVDVRV